MDAKFTPEYFNQFGKGNLPEHLGIVITAVSEGEVRAEFDVTSKLLAPNGFLHAGSVVTLADTACGYACVAHLPEGAVVATAKAVHLGRTTQVWDATVTNKATGKTIALFRCTQMVLYPK